MKVYTKTEFSIQPSYQFLNQNIWKQSRLHWLMKNLLVFTWLMLKKTTRQMCLLVAFQIGASHPLTCLANTSKEREQHIFVDNQPSQFSQALVKICKGFQSKISTLLPCLLEPWTTWWTSRIRKIRILAWTSPGKPSSGQFGWKGWLDLSPTVSRLLTIFLWRFALPNFKGFLSPYVYISLSLFLIILLLVLVQPPLFMPIHRLTLQLWF